MIIRVKYTGRRENGFNVHAYGPNKVNPVLGVGKAATKERTAEIWDSGWVASGNPVYNGSHLLLWYE